MSDPKTTEPKPCHVEIRVNGNIVHDFLAAGLSTSETSQAEERERDMPSLFDLTEAAS